MKFRLIIFFVVVYLLYLVASYYIVKNKEFESSRNVYDFYLSTLNWKVLDKYIDTNEHMGENLIVTPLGKDSAFLFMPSSYRLSYTLYHNIGIGDTLKKNEKSLLISIIKKDSTIHIDTDTAFIKIMDKKYHLEGRY
jgi:hypothetical protein